MTHRERVLAVLNYQSYDRMPVVHFGFWKDTMNKWVAEGHIRQDEADNWVDRIPVDTIAQKLGFDFNWYRAASINAFLRPPFEETVLEELPDGFQKVRDQLGAIVLRKPGTTGIPAEVDHTLKTRKDWETHYKPRLQYSDERIHEALIQVNDRLVRYDEGGLDFLRRDEREYHYGIFCGSLIGVIRNVVGLTGLTYMCMDDRPLVNEMIDTVAELCYQCLSKVLADGARFDFAHIWEDICGKNGPLIIPAIFEEQICPHYRRITDLLRRHDIKLVSLDCDGWIDRLVPLWLANGVNIMFPIEVGTWNASLAPWREKYGRELRGVGGMDKRVFARDFAAIDAEIERLRPLIDLGGYIPCPDHRIAPDAEWDNVRYYCDRLREVRGG